MTSGTALIMDDAVLCTIVAVKCCSGFCSTCKSEFITDQFDKITLPCTDCGPNYNQTYKVLMQVVMKENSKLVQLIGNSLDQLFGMSPLQLHRLLGSIDGTLVEALRGMLVGQCAILTLTQPKTATGSLTATSIQLVGDSCQTILSYPPFSINQPSHLADSPGTPLSASLSHFSESSPSEAIPLISPSPCVASTHTLPPPPPIMSSQHQYEATPELFPEWNQSCNSSPELLPASTSYSTPLPRRTHLSPRTLSDNLSTPEIL